MQIVFVLCDQQQVVHIPLIFSLIFFVFVDP